MSDPDTIGKRIWRSCFLPELEQHILKTMLYFDIFDYPLKSEEVFKYLQTNSVTEEHIQASLHLMAEKKILFQHDQYYSMHDELKNIDRRRRGNQEALKLMPLARKRASLISRFPFVRAVMASGSLSKDYMDEKSDLDFFIVTAPDRLWIARTLLVLYKRIFLFNSHKFFCVNYFIDELHLEIEERNLFTATELATLVPLYNPGLYQRMIQKNSWLKKVFPNYRPRDVAALADNPDGRLKKVSEKILTPFASYLEKLFMKVSLNRFKRIYGKKYSEEDFLIAFKTKTYTSKNHPKNYQGKIMTLYQQRLTDHDLRLT
jgi:hypothetical protein